MTSPHPVTVDVRSRFPLAYQDADDSSGTPLLRWLSLLWDQAGEVSDVVDRIGPDDGQPSALVDPDTADDAWLVWLGQLYGFRFAASMPPDAMRATIRTFTFARGSVPGIRAAAERYMKDGATATVTRTGQWTYTVTVANSDIVGLSYADLALQYPTYADLEAAFPTYADMPTQEPQLIASVAAEKPAGFVSTLAFT